MATTRGFAEEYQTLKEDIQFIDVMSNYVRIGDIIRVPKRNDALAKIIGIRGLLNGTRGHPRVTRYELSLLLANEEEMECTVRMDEKVTIVV